MSAILPGYFVVECGRHHQFITRRSARDVLAGDQAGNAVLTAIVRRARVVDVAVSSRRPLRITYRKAWTGTPNAGSPTSSTHHAADQRRRAASAAPRSRSSGLPQAGSACLAGQSRASSGRRRCREVAGPHRSERERPGSLVNVKRPSASVTAVPRLAFVTLLVSVTRTRRSGRPVSPALMTPVMMPVPVVAAAAGDGAGRWAPGAAACPCARAGSRAPDRAGEQACDDDIRAMATPPNSGIEHRISFQGPARRSSAS